MKREGVWLFGLEFLDEASNAPVASLEIMLVLEVLKDPVGALAPFQRPLTDDYLAYFSPSSQTVSCRRH